MKIGLKAKPMTAKWYEQQMLDIISQKKLSKEESEIVRQEIKKASARAEEAYKCGMRDAQAGNPKLDMLKVLRENNLGSYAFGALIASAYDAGYVFTAKGGE